MWTLPTDGTWKYYGKRAPYFGVFGQDMYLNDNLNDQLLQEFFSSGRTHVDNLFTTIHGKIDSSFKPENILDFGCGPGRFIIPFSNYAKEVVGIDISQEMINEATENCKKFNVTNAKFFLSDDNLKCLNGRKFDLVNSFIVLQHLKTNRGTKLINALLNSIRPNGVGVLQITYYDNLPYRRSVNYFRNRIPCLSIVLRWIRSLSKGNKLRYLPQMQMNNYNLNAIFQLLQKEKITEVYTTFTNHHDYFGINLIFKK